MKTSLLRCICAVFLLLLTCSEAQDTRNDTSDAAASIAFTLQQAVSGQLSVFGVITALTSGCSLSEKTPTAVAEQLPPDFASATVYCNLVTQQAVDNWQIIAQENTDWNTTLPDHVVQALTGLFDNPLLETTQQQLAYLNDDGSLASLVYKISCPAPQDQPDLLPAFLAELPGQNAEPGRYVVLAQGPYIAVPAGLPLPDVDVYPLLGPMGGGTTVMLQGDKFTQDLQCRFGNTSLTYVVNATVVDPQTAYCTSPQWYADNNTRVNFSASTSASDCWSGTDFAYYLDPQVSQVAPLTGPRYGSFELRVQLEETVCSFAEEVDDFTPVIYLEGVLDNGTDLALPANLTSDRRALLATTPLYGQPLAAGNHSVLVSLNGQQLSARLASREAAVLELEGPMVSMVTDYLLVNGTAVTVQARLEGFSSLPVTADLALSQRHLEGQDTSTQPLMDASLSQSYVKWDPFHQGVKTVTVELESNQLAQLQAGAVLITLVNAVNADVDDQRSVSIATQLPQKDLTVSFDLQPNQVFYRDDAVVIPVHINFSTLSVPASMAYDLVLTSGTPDAWLPRSRQKGSLQWDLTDGELLHIIVPVNWSLIPYEAEYHMQAPITDLWNAVTLGSVNETAAHIFGVRPGQCPPGTYRPGNKSAALVPAVAPVQSPDDDTRLSTLLVAGQNGTVFDLSPSFQANVAQYGVMVGADCKDATLCFETLEAGATFDVLNSNNTLLRDLYTYPPSSPEPESSSANSSEVNSAGMQSMSSNATGNSTDAVCSKNAFLLPLQLGQNDFNIAVTAPEPADQEAEGTASTGDAVDSGNRTKVYSLSVVRLADPQHAQLALINVTDSTQAVHTVCASTAEVSTTAYLPQPESAEDASDAGGDAPSNEVPSCNPDTPLGVNVSSETKWVSLQPGLLYPDVDGIRVEVKGQVLSQGGDVGADQIADTSGRSNSSSRNNTGFLPAALVLGLQPGVPLIIPIVVVAEDGVTSQRYFVSVTRNTTEASAPGSAAAEEAAPLGDFEQLVVEQPDDNSTQIDPGPTPALHEALPPGWPLPPAQEPWCSLCPAGWASNTVDAKECSMCMPGYYAENPDSPTCLPCPGGTYSSSWGSSQCSHCITGTYSPSEGSQLCSMCGENTTNLEDGSSSCPVALVPGASPSYRYAVIVSFGVLLNGTALDDIASKAGVNASSEQVLEWLVRADTASAFNISLGDVSVTGVQQVERRILYVNVTATLGVELAPGATPDEVEAAMDLTSLSADDPIGLLSNDPDKFFGRTTKALDVTAEPDGAPATVSENRPLSHRHHAALKWPAILGLCLGSMVLLFAAGRFWRRRSRRMLSWLGLSRFAGFTSFTSARDTGNGSSSAELGVVSPPSGPGPLTARNVKRVSRLPDLAAEPMFGVSHEPSHSLDGAPVFKPRL
ncbi:TPA: hypothetical protein ACH3X2_009068 [Trebouxia sp. C0005]